MKGMILAAGIGTRMGPISRYLAKPAVPFLGVPMIEHSIGILRASGIKEIIINLHHLPETIKELLKDGSRLGVSIEYSCEKTILGSGGGIGQVKDFFEGKTFVAINSDIIIDFDLNQMIEAHRSGDNAATLLVRKDSSGEYGKVVVDEIGKIRKIEGFPDNIEFHGGTDYMFAGVHIIEPKWFDHAPARPVYESFPHVYGPMIAAGETINAFPTEGRWIDLGSAEKFLHASIDCLIGNIIPNPRVMCEESRIKRSILTIDTTVGKNCELDGIICLGKAAIGEECTLSSSIICPGAEIAPGTEASERIFHDSTSSAIAQGA